MKKLIASFIATIQIVSIVATTSVFAEVDYSAKITELEGLLSQCEQRGISTEYEQVNYETLKLYSGYINDDFTMGKSNTNALNMANYNKTAMDNLYSSTKSDLQAYINGTKTPKTVNRPNMSNITTDGNLLVDNENPVFSIGYGHFQQAQQDVPIFQNLGVNNIQMEIGVTNVVDNEFGWKKSVVGDVDVTTSTTKLASYVKSGSYAYKVVGKTPVKQNTYYRMYQKISCKPNTTYKFGVSTKGSFTSNGYVTLSANGYSDVNVLSFSDSQWVQNDYTYKTASDQSELTVQMNVHGECTLYFDDFYVYELNSVGAVVSDNFILDSGFESGDKYYQSLKNVFSVLENAKNNNVAVSLLISPHYFPTYLDKSVYRDTEEFIKYNINAPEVKKILETYLNVLTKKIQNYSALDSICLSNEPSFSVADFPDFYAEDYRSFLAKKHSTIAKLNDAYGSNYTAFSQIKMPTDYNALSNGEYKDYVEFNDKVLSEWHNWMTQIIKKNLPNVEVHSKVWGPYIRSDKSSRVQLARGTDIELFDEFSDYSGIDTSSWMTNLPDTYYRTMLTYDYLRSVNDKPVYDSEDHLIIDEEYRQNDRMRAHVRNNLWQGAIHGRNMATLWQWGRESNYSGGYLYRPDVIATVGKTSLDLQRLSDKVAEFYRETPKVALFYSKSSRIFDENANINLTNAYKALINSGVQVGVVSENSIEQLAKYDYLVIPDCSFCDNETLDKVERFIIDGKKVIVGRKSTNKYSVFSFNDYGFEQSNKFLTDNSIGYSTDNSDGGVAELMSAIKNVVKPEIEIIDNRTGKQATDLDCTYVINEKHLLINISNLDYTDYPNKSLTIKLNGKTIDNLTECITEASGISTVNVKAFEPVLLEYTNIPKPAEIESIDVDRQNNIISWTYSNDNYDGANIYFIGTLNEPKLIKTVTGNSYSFGKNNKTYIVKAVSNLFGESEGKMISTSTENSVDIDLVNSKHNENKVNLEVKLTNNSAFLVNALLSVEILDKNNNVLDSSSSRIYLPNGVGRSIISSYSNCKDAYSIKISVDDGGASKNSFAQSQTFLLTK